MDCEALAIEHKALLDRARPYTKSSDARMASMVHAVTYVDRKKINGDIVECGIWEGGNIILARTLSPQRVCWLYDTFDGMPAPGQFDTKPKGKGRKASSLTGKAKVTREQVIANLRAQDCWDDNLVHLIEGMVEETLTIERNIPRAIAVLRLDTDWYESTKVELDVLYPRLVPGGVLIVDDYGHWLGAKKAVNDYFRKRPIKFHPIDYTAVMAVKPWQL